MHPKGVASVLQLLLAMLLLLLCLPVAIAATDEYVFGPPVLPLLDLGFWRFQNAYKLPSYNATDLAAGIQMTAVVGVAPQPQLPPPAVTELKSYTATSQVSNRFAGSALGLVIAGGIMTIVRIP